MEVGVALGRVVEGDDGGVNYFSYGEAVVEDGLHELAVVLEHWGLAGVEAVGFCPAKAETHLEVSRFAGLIMRARVVGYV
jgi:hypothetical protein